MMAGDNVDDIVDFYNSGVDGEDVRLDHHQLERDMTWRYFDKYLPKEASILEIGAGTGSHTVWLAGRGHQVVAVDFAQAGLERSRMKLSEAGLERNAEFLVDDARILSGVPKIEFDAVLLMGPLYHLVIMDDRKRALEQAVRRLKPGGIFMSSHISRLGILGDLMRNVPGWIEELDEVLSILQRGRDPEDYHKGQFRGYFARVEEIIAMHEGAGLQTLALAGVEPAISADDESYNRLQGAQRDLWLGLLFEISQESSILGASRHLLYVGKK